MNCTKEGNCLVAHLERYLGKISQGWKLDDPPCGGVQVVSYEERMFDSIDIYTTLGLSDHILNLADVKTIKIEFVVVIDGEYDKRKVLDLMHWMCAATLSTHRSVSRGDAYKTPGTLRDIVGFDAVYFTIPNIFADGFYEYPSRDPHTAFVWAIPIHLSEYDFIKSNGWEAFEDCLEQNDPHLWDHSREPVV